jgi:hypothetical protein
MVMEYTRLLHTPHDQGAWMLYAIVGGVRAGWPVGLTVDDKCK